MINGTLKSEGQDRPIAYYLIVPEEAAGLLHKLMFDDCRLIALCSAIASSMSALEEGGVR
jgi:hypothetical protein